MILTCEIVYMQIKLIYEFNIDPTSLVDLWLGQCLSTRQKMKDLLKILEWIPNKSIFKQVSDWSWPGRLTTKENNIFSAKSNIACIDVLYHVGFGINFPNLLFAYRCFSLLCSAPTSAELCILAGSILVQAEIRNARVCQSYSTVKLEKGTKWGLFTLVHVTISVYWMCWVAAKCNFIKLFGCLSRLRPFHILLCYLNDLRYVLQYQLLATSVVIHVIVDC